MNLTDLSSVQLAVSGADVGAPGSHRRPRFVHATLDVIRRLPTAARACFLIALVNAAVWGIVVPPFQVPDEIGHFAYAQYLAETGNAPPQNAGSPYSPQEQTALEKLFFFSVIGHPELRGVLTSAEERQLRAALARPLTPVGAGGTTTQSNKPPLYYAIEAIPYWLSPSHNILTRLALMRLISALMAAGTVLAVFLFLRELFPHTPWSWTVGALVVTFQPVVNFIAAGVQGDNLLFLASSLTFLILLRTYRRGLTFPRAVAIGAVTAVGVLSKLTFLALVPGIALAVLLFGWRALPEGRRQALLMVSTAAVVAAIPALVYSALNLYVWHRGSAWAGGVGGNTGKLANGGAVTLRETLSYTWQLYLPRLPFMHRAYFPGRYPPISIWADGSIGKFGWLDYGFPGWVYTVGKVVLAGLVALSIAAVVGMRRRLSALLPIFACFGVMVLGLLAAIGYNGIRYRLSTGFQFEQARYLFPLLPLWAAFVALAARGAGRRWGPTLGVAFVLLAMAHGLLAETLTIARYYG